MVSRTVRGLVEMSLAAHEGEFLGSEPQLMLHLGISRPTLRQAAKVLESDRLLSVRRGVNGGFYAARPDARHVTQAPALWLRLQSATLRQMNRATTLIFPEIAADAALCTDRTLIAELREFRDALSAFPDAQETPKESVRGEVYFARLIGRMCGDPVLMLFADISYSFGLLERELRFFSVLPERRRMWMELQRSFCDAVLSGDPDAARLEGKRRGILIAQWIDKDQASPDANTKVARAGR